MTSASFLCCEQRMLCPQCARCINKQAQHVTRIDLGLPGIQGSRHRLYSTTCSTFTLNNIFQYRNIIPGCRQSSLFRLRSSVWSECFISPIIIYNLAALVLHATPPKSGEITQIYQTNRTVANETAGTAQHQCSRAEL